MRTVVFSDVHGNLHALEAALAQGNLLAPDYLVCAGDVAHFGPQPNECIALLADRGIPCVRGNHDRDLLEPLLVGPEATPRQKALAEIHNWGHGNLTRASRQYLETLPFSWHVEPAPQQSLLVVHASPERDDEIAPERRQGIVSTYCARAGCKAIVAGHQHTPFVVAEAAYLWINAGSAGASTDGDPRGALAVLDWTGNRWQGQIIRFPYDTTRAAEFLLSSTLPHAQEVLLARQQATWFN